jgi:broad specificity phosphatase PhoE
MGTRVVVVQHGEKRGGPGDPGLTARGREQAMLTARWAANRFDPVAVWASPLRRAVETAMPLAAAIGVDVGVDPRLRERMNWKGEQHQPLADFLAEWQVATSDRSYVPRSGDSSDRAAARFIEAITELTDPLPAGATLAVVAHGGVTVDALRTIAGDEIMLASRPQLLTDGVPCGAITVLDRAGVAWRVTQLPSAAHLDDAVKHRPASTDRSRRGD